MTNGREGPDNLVRLRATLAEQGDPASPLAALATALGGERLPGRSEDWVLVERSRSGSCAGTPWRRRAGGSAAAAAMRGPSRPGSPSCGSARGGRAPTGC